MLNIGERNNLEVLRSTSTGLYLKGHEDEEILLSSKYAPENAEIGDEIEVFLYKDGDGKVIASTLYPKIDLRSFACLKVVAINRVGAFFDMGLDHDLFVPEHEQNDDLNVGDMKILYMYLHDDTEQLVGSMKWREFCFKDEPEYETNQKVEIMIGEKTTLGRNVLIDNAYNGLIYANEIFEELEIGIRRAGYIKSVREDGDIDVSLQKLGYGHVISSSSKILELLKANNGVLEIGDKSDPEKIIAITGMSKKTFKRAIGDLYRKKMVLLDKEQVKLLKGEEGT